MNKQCLRILRILFRIVAWTYWLFVVGCFLFFSPIWYAPEVEGLPPFRLPTLKEFVLNIYHYLTSSYLVAELLILWYLFIPAIIYFYLRFLIRRCIR